MHGSDSPAPASPAPPADRLGDFRIVREVGRGGMGVVYEAEDVNLGRRVALKLLTQRMLRDANHRRRFEREARSAAKLHHTNIVPVFGFGEADGTPYYAMQFIAGAGLDAVVAEVARQGANPSPSAPPSRERGAAAAARSLVTGAFDHPEEAEPGVDLYAATGTLAAAGGVEPPEPPPATGTHAPGPESAPADAPATDTSVVMSGVTSSVTLPGHTASGIGRKLRKLTYWQGVARIGMQAADALDYAHRQGVVHRDVKPSNLLLDAAGTVWVTDFGLAKADGGDNLTHTGDILGTLRYMPPEAFDGKADARSDVYALGLTLYEMLTLRPAFDEADRNKLIKLVTQSEPARLRKVRREVPRDLETIVHKAIDRDPARRYQKAADLAADLQRFLDDEPIKARRQTAAEAAWRWARRHKLEAALLAVVAVGLVAATVASVVLAAHFSHQEYVQRRTADERAALAEHNRKLADDSAAARRTAEDALERSRRSQRDLNLTLSDMYTLQGLQAGPTGRHREAPLWFAKAAELGADDPHRAWANRVRAQAWAGDLSRPVAAFQPPGSVTHRLHFHPGGRHLIAEGLPSRIARPFLCDVEAGRTVPLPGGDAVRSVGWTPDGTRLAVGTTTGVALYTFPEMLAPEAVGVSGTVTLTRFSPDGNLVAVASVRSVSVWDRAARRVVGGPWLHAGEVMTAEFAADGTRLVTADNAGTFRVFKLGGFKNPELSGTHVFARPGWSCTGPLLAGNRLVTAPTTSELTLHALDGSEPARPLRLSFTASAVWPAPDGKLALVSGVSARSQVVRPDTGETVTSITSDGLCAAFHPDGRSVAVGGGNPGFHYHRLPTGGRLPAPAVESTGWRSMAFSADGRLLATTGYEGQVRVWAMPRPDPAEFTAPTGARTRGRPSFSADSRRLLVTIKADSARLYDAATGRDAGPPLRPAAGAMTSAALTPDGGCAVLAVTLPDGKGQVEFRDPHTGTPRHPPVPLPAAPAPDAWRPTVAVDPTGRRGAVLCATGALVLFDPATGGRAAEVATGVRGNNAHPQFSPDGRTLVLRDDAGVDVREAADGKLRFPPLRSDERWAFALSRDGRLIATGGSGASQQGVLRVWDCTTGAQVGPDMRHPSWIDTGVFFHPDGGHVATGGKDGVFRVWDIRTGTQVSEISADGGAAAFTPDGRALVTANISGVCDVWDWKAGTRLLPSRPLGLSRGFGYTGERTAEVSPDGRLAAVGGSPHVAVVSLAALTPAYPWSDRDLLDWGELMAQQEFRGSGPANLGGPEWLKRWYAFRAGHPERLPGDTAPASPDVVAARLVDGGRWADAARVVSEWLAKTPADHGAASAAADLFRKVARARRAGAAVSQLDTAAVRAACETALAANPDRADLAGLLAAALLEARPPVVWHPLRPVAAKSEGGATLTVRPDGSVLASGTLPEQDSYTVEADAPVAVAALRLDVLTDPSLPGDGPGAGPHAGNFNLTEFSVRERRPDGGERPVGLSRASATYRRPENEQTTLRDGPHGAIDGTHATRWDVWGQVGRNHALTADLSARAAGGRLLFRLDFRDPVYKTVALGCFRLAVTDRADVARDENLIALGEKGDEWLQLGVARVVRGEWREAVAPLRRAAAGPYRVDAYMLLALVFDRLGEPAAVARSFDAVADQSRYPDPLFVELYLDAVTAWLAREPNNADVLRRRARGAAVMGRTEAAAADLARALELAPKLALGQPDALALKAVADVAAARGDWAAAAAALERVCGVWPTDSEAWLAAGAVRAHLGDRDAHARLAADARKQFRNSPDPTTVERVAELSLLLPGPVSAEVRKLAEANRDTADPGFAPFARLTMALAEYRDDRFAAAAGWCEKALTPAAPPRVQVTARLALAMAQFRQGKTAEARATLAQAVALTPPPDEARRDPKWADWVIADLLRREAVALTAVPVAPPPRPAKN